MRLEDAANLPLRPGDIARAVFPRFSLKQWKVFIVNDPARNLASMLVGAPEIFEQNLYAPDQVS